MSHYGWCSQQLPKSAGHVYAKQDVASNKDGSADGCGDGKEDGSEDGAAVVATQQTVTSVCSQL